MPAELRPNFKRKLASKEVPPKIVKVVNIEETLKALEQEELAGRRRQEENEDKDKEEQKNSDEENVSNFFEDMSMDEWFLFLSSFRNCFNEVANIYVVESQPR